MKIFRLMNTIHWFGLSVLLCLLGQPSIRAAEAPAYRAETGIVYGTVEGKDLTLNAFLPQGQTSAVPAMVEIHGGWWFGGGKAAHLEQVGGWQWFQRHGLAVFSIDYRLGREGGFPENIRDCRNAIRFIRKNAARFQIDPNRIDVTGGSAGGHLSLMVALAPEDFADGGPLSGLENVSAKVSGSFSYIPPTDFVRFWNQGPGDATTNNDGSVAFRGPDDQIPHDSRPRLRVLFHGVTPDTKAGRTTYEAMSPIGHVCKDVPMLLICDGEKDPIVPGLHGQALCEQLRAAGANPAYWMTTGGGHGFPGGSEFDQVLDQFLVSSLKLDSPPGPR
jgi:acetyl esterase/lipase